MSRDWSKLHLSEMEVNVIIQQVARELSAAQFHSAGEVIEGSERDARVAGENTRRIARIWEAIPLRVRDAYVKARLKEEADKLRAEADKIERGERSHEH